MPFDYNNAVHNKQVSGGTAAEYLAASGSDSIHTNTFYLSAENRLFLGKTVNSLLELALKTDLTVNYVSGIANNNHIIHAVNAGFLSSTLRVSPKAGNRTSVLATAGEEGIYSEGYSVHPDSANMIEIVGNNQIRLLPLAINDVFDAGAMTMQNYLNSVNYSATNKIIQTGDFVICNSEQKVFIHKGTFTGTISDFQSMLVPLPTQATVRTWFGQGDGISYNSTTGNFAVRLGATAGLLAMDNTGGLVANLPTWAQITGKPNFASVATTGSYADLSNKPSIPTGQVNSDWNATAGVAQILNKPTIPTAQVNSDWNATAGIANILNKPTILGTTNQLSKFTANGLSNSIISDNGNIQIDNPAIVNDAKLNIKGSWATDGQLLSYYDVAKYNSFNANETGLLVITLPISTTYNMGTYEIWGYDFSPNLGFWSVKISAYNYDGNTWNYPKAQIEGYAPFSSVRLGTNGTGKRVIILGLSTTTWSYAQVILKTAIVGYQVTATNKLGVGWNIAFATTETGLTNIADCINNTNNVGDAYFNKNIILNKPQGNVTIKNVSGVGVIEAPSVSIQAVQITLSSTNIFANVPDADYPYMMSMGGDGNAKMGKILITDVLKAKNGVARDTDGSFKLGNPFTENTTSNLAGFNYALAANMTGNSLVMSDVSTTPFMLITGKVRNVSDDFEVTATGKGFTFKDDAGNMCRLRCNAAGNFYRQLL